MNKVEKFLINNTKSVLCFLFGFICAFFVIIFYFDYSNINAVYNSKLENINYVEGVITKIETSKNNTDIIIDGCKKEFYIHTSKIKDVDLNVGDNVIIHYSDNSPIRGNYYNIVNLEINNKLVYSLEEYKASTNPNLYLGLSIGSAGVFIILIVVGILLINRDRKVDDVKSFVLANKEKYGLTEEQVNVIVENFEGIKIAKTELDKPKNEVYKMFKDSIYFKNNRIYTSGLELIETEAYGDVFFEVLADTVSERELKVIYDDAYSCEDSIYVVYKINNKVAILNLFLDDDTKLFPIYNNTLYFMFEKKIKPTKEEQKLFIEEIKKYNLYYEPIFKFKK